MSPFFQLGRPGVASMGENSRRSWRRLSGHGCNPCCSPSCHSRSSDFGQRGQLDGDAGRTIGASLQTGEEEVACGMRFRPRWMARPGSLGRSTDQSFDHGNSSHHETRGCSGAQDEVCKCTGPSRRDGVCHCNGGSKTGLDPGLCKTGGRFTPGGRRTFSGAIECDVETTLHGKHSFRRLWSMAAFWEEINESSSIPHLSSSTGRRVHHEGDARTGQLQPVASILSCLQDRLADVGDPDDGHDGRLRIDDREVFKIVPRSLASHCGSRQPCQRRTLDAPQDPDFDGFGIWWKTTRPMGCHLTLGGNVPSLAEGPPVLGRTNPRSSQCLASSRIPGNTFNPGGSHCNWSDERRQGSASTGSGSSCSGLGDTNFGTKVSQPEQEGEQEEKDAARPGGVAEVPQGQWKEQRWQRQGKATALLCLEQQQWGLCWPPTRIRLPRKSRKRAPLHKMQLTRASLSLVHQWNPNLISELKWDWAEDIFKHRSMDACSSRAWLLIFGKSGTQKSHEKGHSSGGQGRGDEGRSRKEKRKRRDDGGEGDRNEEDPDVAKIDGELVTVDEYVLKRKFRFLHYYAGKDDPLGAEIKTEARLRNMQVEVVSCEKERGVDLLQDTPYLQHCEEASEGLWDGFHSGFPCTTYTRLKFRPAPGYPGPLRTRQYPYGLPDLSDARRRECDEGTLHASRSAHLADLVLGEASPNKIRPVATLENPPPSDHPEHLSAWELSEVKRVVDKHSLKVVDFKTCSVQAEIPVGKRNLKPQRFVGSLLNMDELGGECPCGEGAKHEPIIGKEKSEASGKYPKELCVAYAIRLLRHFEKMARLEFYVKKGKILQGKLEGLEKEEKKRKGEKDKKTKAAVSKRNKKEDEKPKASAASSSKAAEPAKPIEEYSYEYEEEETEEETKVSDPTVNDKQVDLLWKGGVGDYGMLKESKAKKMDPSKLNYVGGMRDPASVVEGMPASLNLGVRIFAAWERFTSSHPLALETAAQYGAKDCSFDEKTVADWQADLRRLVASRGKQKMNLKSKWDYQSPLVLDLVEAWTRKSGDPDVALREWIEKGVPLGINEPIQSCGIFPPAEKLDEAEACRMQYFKCPKEPSITIAPSEITKKMP